MASAKINNYILLRDKINKQEAKICVVGLGYVGLPLAVLFAKKGYFVWGLDKNYNRVRRLRRGDSYIVDVKPGEILSMRREKKFFPTTDERILKKADVIIICVPTPLRKVKIPDISYIVEASQMIAKYLKQCQLIILESTSYPTTTRKVVLPILRKSELREEEDFFLCFSPERVNPGDNKFTLERIPKIVGGLSEKASNLARVLYSKIIKKVYIVSSPEVAETSKLLENTFRLVNIALANEFALVCNKLGVNIWEVVEAAKTKPFGFIPFYPGPGIGGHCIPSDPLYLSWKAKRIGFPTRMIDLASYINRLMPKYVVARVKNLLRKSGVSISKAKVLVLGVTYKKDVKDLRESPALEIIEGLLKKGTKVDYYDPLVPYLKIKTLDLKRVVLTEEKLKNYDCIVLVTDHSQVDYEFIRVNAGLIFDTRNVYKKNFDNIERL